MRIDSKMEQKGDSYVMTFTAVMGDIHVDFTDDGAVEYRTRKAAGEDLEAIAVDLMKRRLLTITEYVGEDGGPPRISPKPTPPNPFADIIAAQMRIHVESLARAALGPLR
jgi:hypothetical protein